MSTLILAEENISINSMVEDILDNYVSENHLGEIYLDEDAITCRF